MNRRRVLGYLTGLSITASAGYVSRLTGHRRNGESTSDYAYTGDDWPMLAADSKNTGERANSGITDAPKSRWRVSRDRTFDAGVTVEEGMVFAGDNGGQVIAVEEETGAVAWKTQVDARRLVEPVASGDTVVVAGRGRESVSVLYSDDGSLAYSVRTQDTHSITEAPTIADGVCYVPVDLESGEQTMGRLIAIDLKDGKKEWDLDFSTPISTPALLKNGVYVGTVGGTLEWVDIQGAKRERIATVEGNVSCPPTAAGSTVYCGGMNGFVYAIDTQTEEYIWKTALQEPIRASPAADEQSVYAISMDGTVVRIDRQSGERAWKFETQPVVTARSISLVGDTVYVPTDWGAVGVDKRSGKEQWRWNGGNANHAAPAIANGTMYLTLTQGDIVGVS